MKGRARRAGVAWSLFPNRSHYPFVGGVPLFQARVVAFKWFPLEVWVLRRAGVAVYPRPGGCHGRLAASTPEHRNEL